MPSAISFTVETDGRLPSGDTLGEAIAKVDAVTGDAPAYYMINCAHPTHFQDTLKAGEGWHRRIAGIRANASTKSHAELDQAQELDAGNPQELAAQYRALISKVPSLNVLGGCCGNRSSPPRGDLQGLPKLAQHGGCWAGETGCASY